MSEHEAPQPLTDPEAISAVSTFLSTTVADMGMECTVSVHEMARETVFELRGPDAQHVVGKKGVTLDALQTLASRVASKHLRGERAAIVVDAAGWREEREQALLALAQKLGQQCVAQGKVIVMDPLPPRERRVIHMALARFAGVSTQSEGEGEERRIKIIPMPDPNAPRRR
jgi:spoIIIJ-associated protein